MVDLNVYRVRIGTFQNKCHKTKSRRTLFQSKMSPHQHSVGRGSRLRTLVLLWVMTAAVVVCIPLLHQERDSAIDETLHPAVRTNREQLNQVTDPLISCLWKVYHSIISGYRNGWLTLKPSAVSCDSIIDSYKNGWMTLPPSAVSCDSVIHNYTNGWMTLPPSGVSCDSVIDNYTNRWMTLPPSVVFYDSVVDNYTNGWMTLSPSTFSCDSVVDNYTNRWMTLPPSPVSCDSIIDNYTNGWMTLSPSALSYGSTVDNYTNRWMTLPPSAVSCDSVVDNYANRWMTLSPSAVSCDSVVDNYTNGCVTLPPSVVSCDSVIDNYTNGWVTLPPSAVSYDSVVDNYTNRWMTLPPSAVSCNSVIDNYTNRWMTLPPSPVSCDSDVDNYTNRWMTLPPSAAFLENDMCPITEKQSKKTCSYLIGNAGIHAYNGNPPMHGGAEKEVHMLHCEMVIKLSDLVHPGMGNFWEKFVFMLEVYLTSEEISGANNIFKVCKTLETKGIIKHGQYGVLKQLFAVAGLKQCCEIVEEYSLKIEGTRRKALPLCTAETLFSQNAAETIHNQDTTETVHSQDTTDTVHSQGTAESLRSQATTETVHRQDTAEKVHSQATAERVHSQDTAETMHSQDTAETVHSQATAETVHSQATADTVHSQDTAETVHSQDTAETVHSQDTAETVHSQDTAERVHSQDTAETVHSQDTTDTVHSQDTAETVHSQDTAETVHSQDTTESVFSQDTGETRFHQNKVPSVSRKRRRETSPQQGSSSEKNPEQEDVVDVLAQHAAGFVLPAYITSEADRKLYHASVKEGKEQYRHIRVLFIGHESVGKTTLCGFLTTGKVPDLGHRESTYGADIFLHRMEIDWTTKKWINLDVPEADIVANRLGNVCASTEELQKTKVEVDKDTLKVEEVQPITTKEKPTSFINTPPETFTTMEEILTYTPNKIPEGNSQEQTFENKEQKIKYDPFEGQVLQAKKKGKKEIANVSFWDFAGQDDFYSSHHIFLSPDGVYVIVCNAKRCLEGMDEEKESECDKLVYWLRSVKTYSTSSEEEEDSPPIIVAGTHADQLQNLRDGQRRLVEFVSDLLERREIHGITVEWCILVDYTNGEETLNKLRGNIEEAAPRQDQWEKDIPAKWLALEHSILEEKTKNRKVLKWDEVKVLNKDIKAPIEKDEELKLFLRYLHESRHVIYFGEDGILSEEVIIDPKWLVDAFRCIITSEQFIGTEKLKLRKLLKDLQKSGKLKDNLIECAWQQDFIGNKELLLSVMERFGLIALPVEFRENIGRKDTFYIIPSFLKTLDKHPDEICQTNKDLAKQGCSLYLNFEQKFVPNEIYDRLIASCIANRKPTFDFDKCVFRHFGFFSVDKVLYFAVHCHHSFITLTLYRSNQKRDSAADEVRKWIEDRLQEILKLNRQECLKYTYSFHQNVLVNPDYLISLEEIKRHDEVPCRTKDKVYKSIESSDAEFWGILPKVLPEGNTEEIEKKKIHSQMLQKLHESLYLDCSQWTAFRNMLKPYITENELSKVIDIFGVAENLMQAGWIYYGKYDTLSEIFSTIGMKELQKVVQTYTEKF